MRTTGRLASHSTYLRELWSGHLSLRLKRQPDLHTQEQQQQAGISKHPHLLYDNHSSHQIYVDMYSESFRCQSVTCEYMLT